ncbi:MAG: VWA domain-containing protein [Acidobacteria bacterium]|nr:VWA domain-containing protein [Acidobacteriota bacterium]
MKNLWVGLLLVVALSAFALAQKPQEQKAAPPRPQAPNPADQQTISVEVNQVDIFFTVTDKRGKFITNLKKEDFRVAEDNRAQIITNFSTETDLPLTIALLVDTSGSIRDKLRFEQEAAIEFFYSTLQRGKDKALVISFDSAPELLQDFTDNPETLADAVRKIRAGGGTALYDAVYLAVEKKLTGQTGRKVLILISDGDDNSSRLSLTETLEVAQRNEVTLYTISTNSAAYFGSKEQDRGDKTLKKFAEETGGKPFFPLKIQDLANSFTDIHQELRSQYSIGYRPTNARADGTYRKIRVDVTNKDFKARHRPGYYMPKATATSQR